MFFGKFWRENYIDLNIDIVVDGNGDATTLVKALESSKKFSISDVVTHSDFKTCTVTIDNNIKIDFATARMVTPENTLFSYHQFLKKILIKNIIFILNNRKKIKKILKIFSYINKIK